MQVLPKKVAVINDFSGWGRCSVAVALPVLSAMKLQCSLLPTAILSNHTGYPSYFFESYTDKMPKFITEWQKLSLKFDSIYSGFLGCREQIDIVCKFIDAFKKEKSVVIVDPVMGDNGKIYATYTNDMCQRMAILCEKADVITPNITEACILANETYIGEEIAHEQALRLLEKLSLNQKRSVVITGISNKSSIESAVYDSKENDIFFAESAKSPITYPGTGDLFASILCGGITNEVSLKESAQFASDFISRAATFTSQFKTDVNDGIAFESFIHELTEFKAPRG